MCRMLFAYIPDSNTDRSFLLRTFLHLAEHGNVPQSITRGHHDGWGLASYARGTLLRHYRSKGSGASDPARDHEFFLVDAHKPDALLAHVRKETVGEPSEQNSHPFVSGRFSFIHNGTLGKTDQSIFDPVRGRTIGETDSEYYPKNIAKDMGAGTQSGRV